MKISLHSDLHNESSLSNPVIVSSADVIVLAGDNHEGLAAHHFACEVADDNPSAHVLWIAGNHEYYGGELNARKAAFKKSNGAHPRVTFLDDSHIEMGGVEFIGSTLWTDFNLFAKGDHELLHEHRQLAQKSIPDFQAIDDANDEYRRFTARKMSYLYSDACRFIRKRLRDSRADKKVVISHFAPTEATQHREFVGQPLSAYFNADVSRLFELKPDAWLFGHTHCNASTGIEISGVPVHCNQGGYRNELKTGYDSGYIIDV